METTGNITKKMEQNTKERVTTFTKEICKELGDAIDKQLVISKKTAEKIIKEKLAQSKEQRTSQDTKDKDTEKRKHMKAASVCYMKCNLCKHIGKENVVIEGSSRLSHFRAFHQTNMSECNPEMMKSCYPVVKIIRK